MDPVREGTSGTKVVVILVIVVLLISASASWYGMSLRSEMPHTADEHPDSDAAADGDAEDGSSEEVQRAETEDFMREIGYVQ
jgi:hypothetical protein